MRRNGIVIVVGLTWSTAITPECVIDSTKTTSSGSSGICTETGRSLCMCGAKSVPSKSFCQELIPILHSMHHDYYYYYTMAIAKLHWFNNGTSIMHSARI